MTESSYRTLGPVEAAAELEAKRSRFVATVRRVSDEAAAQALLADQRRLHHAARHHCSAFVIGADRALVRASDDGEPSGTAGLPMLNVLLGSGLSDIAAVVVRYFGGTLLGAGGLARAYSGAVSLALQDAVTVRRDEMRLIQVLVSHEYAGSVESALRSRGVRIDSVDYGSAVTLAAAVRLAELATLPGRLAALTGGTAELAEVGTTWT